MEQSVQTRSWEANCVGRFACDRLAFINFLGRMQYETAMGGSLGRFDGYQFFAYTILSFRTPLSAQRSTYILYRFGVQYPEIALVSAKVACV